MQKDRERLDLTINDLDECQFRSRRMFKGFSSHYLHDPEHILVLESRIIVTLSDRKERISLRC